MRWQIGTVTVSPAAAALLAEAGVRAESLIARYRAGEWGEQDEYHASFCTFAVAHGLPVLSRYPLPNGLAVALVTSADCSQTRLLTLDEAVPEEVSVDEGYARWAENYDQELNQLIVLEQIAVDRLLAGFNGRDVLDAATGTGRHALALARRGARVVAIDSSPAMLARAKQHAARGGLVVRWLEASLNERLPFAAAQFDLVICALAFCHLPDIVAPCREFARVLRPGGTLLLTDFHPDTALQGWRTVAWRGAQQYVLPNYPHTRDGYLAAVADAGFSLHAVEDIPVRALPPEAGHPGLIARFGDVPFCLVIDALR